MYFNVKIIVISKCGTLFIGMIKESNVILKKHNLWNHAKQLCALNGFSISKLKILTKFFAWKKMNL